MSWTKKNAVDAGLYVFNCSLYANNKLHLNICMNRNRCMPEHKHLMMFFVKSLLLDCLSLHFPNSAQMRKFQQECVWSVKTNRRLYAVLTVVEKRYENAHKETVLERYKD